MEKLYGTFALRGKNKERPGWIEYFFRAQSSEEALKVANDRFPNYEWKLGLDGRELIREQEDWSDRWE